MCLSKYKNIKNLNKKFFVNLPHGIIKVVQKEGIVCLSKAFSLYNVMHIPSFNYNLLSVSKVLQGQEVKCIFYSEFCLFQDLKTNEMVVVDV